MTLGSRPPRLRQLSECKFGPRNASQLQSDPRHAPAQAALRCSMRLPATGSANLLGQGQAMTTTPVPGQSVQEVWIFGGATEIMKEIIGRGLEL